MSGRPNEVRSAGMIEKATIEVQIDRKALEIILEVFRIMRDVPGIVDYNAQNTPEPHYLPPIIQKLEDNLRRTEEAILSIPMNTSEWNDFSSFLRYSSDAEHNPIKSEFLSDLYCSFADWEDADFKPKLEVLKPE
jgi:hypothetical protein